MQTAQMELRGLDKKSLGELQREKEKELNDLKREHERVRRKEESIESDLQRLHEKAFEKVSRTSNEGKIVAVSKLSCFPLSIFLNWIQNEVEPQLERERVGLEYGERIATLSLQRDRLLRQREELDQKIHAMGAASGV